MSTPIAGKRQEKLLVCLREKVMPPGYTPWVKTMAFSVVLANIVLIISGGIVRLTGSGLGCDTWPRCTSTGSWTTTPEMGIHGIVEFGNRLLTFVLMLITVLTFLSILRIVFPHRIEPKIFLWSLITGARNKGYSARQLGLFFEKKGMVSPRVRYPDLYNLTLLLLWGIPLQAVVGGISVWLKLNPWMITTHFYITAIMIALASAYLNRVLRYFNSATQQAEQIQDYVAPVASATLRGLGWISALLVAFLVFMGTVTTGTGPHAGDPEAHRHAFNPVAVTRMHSLSVWAFCIIAVILFVLAKKYDWAPTLRRVLLFIFALIVYQGIVGYVQYFNGLPVWLVELHLVGSGFFIWASSSLLEKVFTISSSRARRLAISRLS